MPRLTPKSLRRIVLQEKRKLDQRRMREVLETGQSEPEKISADEYEPGTEASTLEKDINHLKVLKVKEARLRNQLRKITESRRRLKKRVIQKLN